MPTSHRGIAPPRRTRAGLAARLLMPLLGLPAVALLLVAALGRDVPYWATAAAAAAFVAVAVLWFLADRWSRRGTTGIPLWPAVLLCAYAAGLLVSFAAGLWQSRAILLAAAFALYVGGGELVIRWRHAARRPLLAGAGALAVSAVLAVIAFRVLDLDTQQHAMWLATVAAAVAPLAFTFFAEAALRRLDRGDGRWPPRLLAAGVCLTVAVLVAGAVATDSTGLIAVGLALAVGLAVLAASNTPADLALVVAGLAVLLAATPPAAEPDPALSPSGGTPPLVAIGDSYMSGEGAQSFIEGTDTPRVSETEHNECRRATTSYAAELVLGRDGRFDRLAFVACSGARARHLWRLPQYPSEPGGAAGALHQIDHLAHLRLPPGEPGLIVLSIGGNDSGFSTIGLTCGGPGDCTDIEHYWLGNLRDVADEVGRAYQAVRGAFPDTPVLAVPYVLPMSDGGDCGEIWLTLRERAFVDRFARALNSHLKEQAQDARFHFLDAMQDAMAARPAGEGRQARGSLRLCDVPIGDAGVNFVGLRSVSGGLPRQALNPRHWVHNSLHPNERGHNRMGQVVREWLDDHPDPAAQAAPEPDGIPLPQGRLPDPGCSVFDEGETGCKERALEWGKGEALEMAPMAALAGAAVALGAALTGVGTVAETRRRKDCRRAARANNEEGGTARAGSTT